MSTSNINNITTATTVKTYKISELPRFSPEFTKRLYDGITAAEFCELLDGLNPAVLEEIMNRFKRDIDENNVVEEKEESLEEESFDVKTKTPDEEEHGVYQHIEDHSKEEEVTTVVKSSNEEDKEEIKISVGPAPELKTPEKVVKMDLPEEEEIEEEEKVIIPTPDPVEDENSILKNYGIKAPDVTGPFKRIVCGLVSGRHEDLDNYVNDLYIFDSFTSRSTVDYNAMYTTACKFIDDHIHFENGYGVEELEVYLTGHQGALAMLVNACIQKKVSLLTRNYHTEADGSTKYYSCRITIPGFEDLPMVPINPFQNLGDHVYVVDGDEVYDKETYTLTIFQYNPDRTVKKMEVLVGNNKKCILEIYNVISSSDEFDVNSDPMKITVIRNRVVNGIIMRDDNNCIRTANNEVFSSQF